MKKKILLRASFIVLFFSIFIFIYYNLNYKNDQIIKKEKKDFVKKEIIEIDEEKIQSSNIIEDVSYLTKDAKGNEYSLKAGEGTIDQNENNYIFLKSVKAFINLKNYEVIEVSSDFGKYNINNYDTIFSKNVIITYLNNKITSDYLDFSWDKNLMIISRKVILESDKDSLQADVIEVNIKTRDIKIFMYEEDKRVNFKSTE
ncbi:LPS export ABC transporter periplasmic protein LptC [Candidatus Pelagibacter sp.]|nr:LPS export ABC transporter periplasmic protein LptC [Candidatus Pelagibacter sp.]